MLNLNEYGLAVIEVMTLSGHLSNIDEMYKNCGLNWSKIYFECIDFILSKCYREESCTESVLNLQF